MKRCILWRFSFVCFATVVVQNLSARKTEKNKEGVILPANFVKEKEEMKLKAYNKLENLK
jgi:hypothetical protein